MFARIFKFFSDSNSCFPSFSCWAASSLLVALLLFRISPSFFRLYLQLPVSKSLKMKYSMVLVLVTALTAYAVPIAIGVSLLHSPRLDHPPSA